MKSFILDRLAPVLALACAAAVFFAAAADVPDPAAVAISAPAH